MPLSARETGQSLQASARTQLAPGASLLGRTPENPLLVKDDVGKAKPSCYDLPERDVPYGRPLNMDAEGAREVSMLWVSHTASRPPVPTAPDFIRLHKKAAGSHATTPRDLKHFRKEHDATYTPRAHSARPFNEHGERIRDVVVPSDVIPNFTYGRKVRPSTPVQDVISNRFAERSEMELNKFYSDFHEARVEAANHIRKIPMTAAARGHASRAKQALLEHHEGKELFKIKKFTRTSPKVVNTHHRKIRVDSDGASSVGVEVEVPKYEDSVEGSVSGRALSARSGGRSSTGNNSFAEASATAHKML